MTTKNKPLAIISAVTTAPSDGRRETISSPYIELVGADGTTVHVSWDDYLGGFKLSVQKGAEGRYASTCSVVPIAANVVVLRAEPQV